MIAINHAFTGAFIGLAVGSPVLALPVALVSHFICDAMPHFGMGKDFITTKAFRNFLLFDGLLCVALVIFLAVVRPNHWVLAAVCAFVAAAPDFLWIPLYRQRLEGVQFEFKGFYKFASGIQWFERPIGGVIEATWFLAVGFLVVSLALV